MSCALDKVHADLIALAETAAAMAYDAFEEAALDDHVIRSAIRQVILNLDDVPEGVFADAIAHTRQLIEQRIKGGVQ